MPVSVRPSTERFVELGAFEDADIPEVINGVLALDNRRLTAPQRCVQC